MLCFFMFIIAIISLVIAIKYFYYDEKFKDSNSIKSIINSDTTGDEFLNQISNISTEELAKDQNGNLRTGSVTAGNITVSSRKE